MKLNSLFSFVYFALILHCAVANRGNENIGTFAPSEENGISLTSNNMGETADYTFTFISSNTMAAGDKLKIYFPEQYASGLGVTTCTANLGTCTITVREVEITLTNTLSHGSLQVLTLTGVANPTTQGGTGPFMIESWKGTYLIDQNVNYGVIGIAAAAGTLTSTSFALQAGSTSQVGKTASYDLQLTPQTILPAWSWIRINFPTEFVPTQPGCAAFELNEYILPGSISCTADGQVVMITGISEDIQPATDLGVRVTTTNPGYALTTSTFTVETGRNSTNTIYEHVTAVAGVSITAGDINDVSLLPIDDANILSKLKQVVYNLLFTPANTVPAGGEIDIVFSTNFNLDNAVIQTVVNSGIEENSTLDLLVPNRYDNGYNSVTKTLTISNFKELASGSISINMQLTNPDSTGKTIPLIIRTKDASGNVIDENSTDAWVTITTTSAPTITGPTATLVADGTAQTLAFEMTPKVMVPASGYIAITVPSGFTASSSDDCEIFPSAGAAYADAASCDYDSDTRVFKFKNNATAADQFVVNAISKLQWNASITFPSVAGDYIFDFNTKDQDEVTLESGSVTVTLVAQTFVSDTVVTLNTVADDLTILQVKVQTNAAIDASATPSTTYGSETFFDIALPIDTATPGNAYASDLGISAVVDTSIVCRSAVTTDSAMSCKVNKVDTTNNEVIISAWGFPAITANTDFEFYIAGIKTPVNNAQSCKPKLVEIYKMENRVKTQLERDVAANFGTRTTTTAITPTVADGVATSTSQDVSTTTNLLITAQTIPVAGQSIATSYMIVQITSHDTGYCAGNPDLTCKAGATAAATDAVSCLCFDGTDLILITGATSGGGGSDDLEINGLLNPISAGGSIDSIVYTYIDAAGASVASIAAITLPAQAQGTLTSGSLTANYLGSGYFDVLYSWEFIPTNDIPAGGSIDITMSINDLQLASRNPAPVCSSGNLQENTAAGVTCTYTNSVITLGNFTLVSAGTTVYVTMSGIINPTNVAATGDFQVTTKSTTGLQINLKSDCTGFTYGTAYSPASLNLSKINNYPSNQAQLAEYEVIYTPTSRVPAGSVVSIIFPAEFSTLPPTATCRVTGGMTTFSSCVNNGLTIEFTTDEEYYSGDGAIHFHIYDVTNFSAGVSSDFTAKITYDGTTIEQSYNTVAQGVQTVVITAAPADITVSSIDFYPQNEGEKATYEFHFKPSIDVGSDYSFVVVFPEEFDVDLGSETLYCTATGLTGTLACSVNVREVTITGHGDYTACTTCSISLYIYGPLNPQYNAGTASGQFKIGAKLNEHYSVYNVDSGTVTFKSAPGYNNLLETLTDSTSSRLETNMQFNITTQQTIPRSSNQGAVWVRYDEQFLLDVSEITCRATDNWDADPTCTQQYDTVKLVGPNLDFVGNMIVYLSNVQNPRAEVTSKSTVIKTYDGLNKAIVDSSYANLNPNRFVYTYPGPLIGVNNDAVLELNPGRMSSAISIDFVYPCALNLTLVPSTDDIVFEPYNIETFVGMKSAEFQISVPANSDLKGYVIDWEVLGDVVPSYYTDIAKTEFNVVTGSASKIRVATIDPVQAGASSLPIRVYLDYAPDQDITVSIASVDNADTAGKITLSASSLQFLRGTTEQYFTFIVDSTVTLDNAGTAAGSLLFSVTGTNIDQFEMDSDTSNYSIITGVNTTPFVESISTTDITKIKATVQVTSNVESKVWWAAAAKGTTAPTFSELQQIIRGEISKPDFFMYGEAYTYTQNSLLANVAITGLRADRSYSFYCWLQNMQNTVSEQVSVYSYETDRLQFAASFVLGFNQEYINDDDLNEIQASLQRVLSLPSWRLRTDGTNVSSRRRRLDTSSKSYVSMTIVDDPESENYPVPSEIVNRINSQMSTLATLLSTIDTEQTVQSSVITMNECVYVRGQEPVISEIAATSMTISSMLEENATVYAVAVLTNSDGNEPNPEQIYLGVSSTNQKAASGSSTSVGKTINEVVITGMKPYEFYSIYVTCGNEYPQEHQLASDDYTVSLPITLTMQDIKKPLDLDSAYVLFSVLLALLI